MKIKLEDFPRTNIVGETYSGFGNRYITVYTNGKYFYYYEKKYKYPFIKDFRTLSFTYVVYQEEIDKFLTYEDWCKKCDSIN